MLHNNAKVFPETQEASGIIESPLVNINSMKQYLQREYKEEIPGQLFLKCDSHLPISGPLKARGGVYKVLKHAEDLALKHHLLTKQDDYSVLDSDRFRTFFSNYSIAVGSTRNLGLSIGIMSVKLGFNVTVRMSTDAKMWKKIYLEVKRLLLLNIQQTIVKR